MSEEPKEKVKKKGSKLPIIAALVLVAAGGGFFVMKGKGDGKPKEIVIKLSKVHPEPLKEFLVNLRDNGVYLRTEIALHPMDGFDVKKMEENGPAVQDAIIGVLTSKSLEQIRTPTGKKLLKKEIASAVNEILSEGKPEEPKPDPKEKSKEKVVEIVKKIEPEATKEKPKERVPEDWDSLDGPILKVYFVSFATQ